MKYVGFDYVGARDTSWKVAIKFGICKLPVKVSDLCKECGFVLLSYKKGMEHIREFGLMKQCKICDGFTVLKDGIYYIFYNGNMRIERGRFTIAHELGHIFMGHLKEGQVTQRNKEPSAQDMPIEQEANVFASRLLAPACVLHDLGATTPERIAEVCNISMCSARYRAGRMGVLEKRCKFDTSPLERVVHKQYRTYIQEMQTSG